MVRSLNFEMQGPEFATIVNSATSKKVAAWLWWVLATGAIKGEREAFQFEA